MTNTAGERNTGASHRTSRRKMATSQMLRLNTWMSLGASLLLKRSVHSCYAIAGTNGSTRNVPIVLSPSRLSDSYPIVSMAKDLER